MTEPTTAAGRVNDDEHWHRGPSQSCSICQFGTRQQDDSALRGDWPHVEPGSPCADCGAILHGYPCIHHNDGCPFLAALPSSAPAGLDDA